MSTAILIAISSYSSKKDTTFSPSVVIVMKNNTTIVVNYTLIIRNSAECNYYEGFGYALLIYSIVVIFFYALLQRRTNKFQGTCHGYFGIPVPVDLIHETKDRWVYAAAFGALAGQLVTLITQGSNLLLIHVSNKYVESIFQGIILMITIMIYPLLYFALFASIHGTAQILSHLIGFVYVLLSLIQLILTCNSCDSAVKEITNEGIIRNVYRANVYGTCIPIGICLGLVGGYFVFRGIQSVVLLILKKPFPEQHDVTHHIGYVRRLFKRPTLTVQPSNRVLAIIQRYMYQWDPYFNYSVRVISAGVVVFVALIVVTFQGISFLVYLANLLDFIFERLSFKNEHEDLLNAVIGLIYFFSILIPLVSLVIVMIAFLTSLASYRRQCKLIWKGDQYRLIMKKKPPAQKLVSSFKYFGFQVAMSLWSWILYGIIFVLITSVFIGFIVAMVLVSFIKDWVLTRFVLYISSFVVGLAIYYVQYFTAKYLFVSKDGALIDNRRLFHIFTFYLIFYYALVGLFKAILRIILTAVLNLFYLSRLDTALTIKGWEWLDKAYSSYISVLSVDATHNNPVLNVFIYLLSLEVQAKTQSTFEQELQQSSVLLATIRKITVTNYYSDVDSLSTPLVQPVREANTSRAKKWWFLAYTMIRNPDLIELRKRSDMERNKLVDPK